MKHGMHKDMEYGMSKHNGMGVTRKTHPRHPTQGTGRGPDLTPAKGHVMPLEGGSNGIGRTTGTAKTPKRSDFGVS